MSRPARTLIARPATLAVIGLTAALIVAGCLDTDDPTRAGSLAIRFDAQGSTNATASHLDSANVILAGPTSTTTTLVATAGSTQLTGTINGLAPGAYTIDILGYSAGVVTYRQHASASVTAGNTAVATVTAPSASPFLVGTLTLTSTSTTQVTLTWKDSATNEDGFKVERCTGTCGGAEASAGKFSVVTTVAANATTYTDAGLTPGTYTYRVRAYAGTGFSAYSNFATVTTGSGGGAIALSPSTVTFGATPGGASPQPQVVTVTNSATGTLSGLTLGTITYVTGTAGWLSASLNGTTAPAAITLTPTTGTLAAGSYSATVAVTSSAASNSPQTITVNLTVSSAPIVAVDQATLSFSAAVGGGNPLSRQVLVTNGGTGILNGLSVGTISYAAGGTGWLTATLSTAAAPAVLVVTPTTGSLAAGTYNATVPVSTTLNGVTQNVAVTFNVGSTALISVSSATASFAAAPGGANPSPQAVTVSNGGTGSLTGLTMGTITYSSGGTGWLATSLNTTTAPASLTLTPTTGALAAGTYSATVPITASGISNSPQNVVVTFVVASTGQISLSPTSAFFAAAPGGANPASQAVSVANGGGGSLTSLSVGAIGYGPGATGWLGAALGAGTAPTTLTLTPTTGSLAAGTYTAFVPILAASGSPRIVPVTFVVSSTPLIGLSATSASFIAGVGQSNPSQQTITVGNIAGGSLTNLAVGTIAYGAGATGWLNTSLSTTTAPSTLTLTPITGVLAAGTYTATVPITSTAASNSPQNVTVSFTVTNSAVLTLSANNVTFAGAPGGASPASQSVTVQNGGPSPLTGVSLGAISYGAGGSGWLTASLASTTGPTNVALSATQGALAAGTYTATVPVNATSAPNSPQTISITFIVSNNPLIAFGTPSVNVGAATGGASPVSQFVTMLNSGGGSLTGLGIGAITYQGTASGWLSAAVSSTTAPGVLALTPTTGTLTAGYYSATVPITSGVASNSPQSVNVTFTVSGIAVIGLSQSVATFVAPTGGASPAAQTIAVTNVGGGASLSGLSVGSIAYSSGATGWLGAALGSGTAPTTLTLTPTTTSLAAGTYTAFVPISGAAANQPQTVTVSLTVGATPLIQLSAATQSFVGGQGQASPSPATISVTNGGGGTLSGLTIGTIAYGAGGSGWLAAGFNTTTAPATLTLTPTTGLLTAGTYSAAVPIYSATASPVRLVTVQFVVTPPPTIGLSPSAVGFAATPLGPGPAAQIVNVTSGNGVSLSGLAVGTIGYSAGATGWLTTASLSGTSAPAVLTLAATPGSLVAGTYTATVPLTGTGATTQNVTVTLNVSSSPLIALGPPQVGFGAQPGGSNPTAFGVNVINVGGGALSAVSVGTVAYSAGANGWLNASISGGNVVLAPTTGSLTAGTYTATVPVISAAAANSPQNLTVTFTVSTSPLIALTASSTSYSVTQGGASPSPNIFTVNNGGGATLSGLALGTTIYGSGASGWLNAALGGTTAPTTVTITPTTGTLAPGTYWATVPLTSSVAANGTQTIDVAVTVTPTTWSVLSRTPTPYAGSASFISRTTAFSAGFNEAMNNGTSTTFVVNGAQHGRLFVGGAYTGGGTSTLSTPAASLFAGEEVEVTLTTGFTAPSAATPAAGPLVTRYRAATTAQSGVLSQLGSPIAVGTNPYGLATGDINGDGKLDIVSANSGASTISVLLGNGDGTFTAGTPVSVSTNPYAVALADVNGDGKLDMITANYGASTVSILLGNGNGTFTQASGSPITVGTNPLNVTLGDLNGDGKLDLVVGNFGSGTVTVLLGNGDGTFTAATGSPVTVGTHPFAAALGDLNNDGKLDLVVSNNVSGTVSVLLGNGDGTFTAGTSLTAANAGGIVLADLNGDGKLDVAVTNNPAAGTTTNINVFLGNGAGAFGTASSVTVGTNPVFIAAGDVDGDGALDLVVTNQGAASNSVTVLKGSGTGTFPSSLTGSPFTVGVNPIGLVLADLNGDGRLDIVVANNTPSNLTILLNH